MRNQHEELQGQLNALADWIEKGNNVHADSVPRKAAYTIARLEEENYQMRLLLNKRETTIADLYNRFTGKLRLMIYLVRKKYG